MIIPLRVCCKGFELSSKVVLTLVRSVYDVAWQGIPALTRKGPDYTPGSTRTYSAPTTVGNLTFTEMVRSSTCFQRHFHD